MGLDEALAEVRQNRTDLDAACKRFAELAKTLKLPFNDDEKYGRQGWEILGLKSFRILVLGDGQWAVIKGDKRLTGEPLDHDKEFVPDAREVEKYMAKLLDHHSH